MPSRESNVRHRHFVSYRFTHRTLFDVCLFNPDLAVKGSSLPIRPTGKQLLWYGYAVVVKLMLTLAPFQQRRVCH